MQLLMLDARHLKRETVRAECSGWDEYASRKRKCSGKKRNFRFSRKRIKELTENACGGLKIIKSRNSTTKSYYIFQSYHKYKSNNKE